MPRLYVYLLKNFAIGAFGIFAIIVGLVWLTNTLRLFDLVTAKGQDMLTLAGQALLITPPLAREITQICFGIGIARTLTAMQNSRELHVIHAARQVPQLWSAIVTFALLGGVMVMLLSHWIDPWSRQRMIDWSAEIAAEFLGQTLKPGQFTPVAEGVTVSIGGRAADGTLEDFFADDNRDPAQRLTFFAETAEVLGDEEGYMLILSDGLVQSDPADGQFSSIAFREHRLAFDRFATGDSFGDGFNERSTSELWQEAQAGDWSARLVIAARVNDSFRVAAMCILVGAIAGFPHARRRRSLFPLEAAVVGLAFLERGFVEAMRGPFDTFAFYLGPLMLFALAAIILARKVIFPFGLPRPAGFRAKAG